MPESGNSSQATDQEAVKCSSSPSVLDLCCSELNSSLPEANRREQTSVDLCVLRVLCGKKVELSRIG